MDFSYLCPPELGRSSLVEPLKALHAIYEDVEAATSAFRDSAQAGFAAADAGLAPPRFGCPEGCGACCERFLPDILPVEADYAALWILGRRPDLAPRATGTGGKPPCPFYDADRPQAHCSIYPARPLICRLFGYSAVGTKKGGLAYSLCWAMPDADASGKRHWEGEDLRKLLSSVPPSMADFGLRLQSIAPETPSPKPYLGEAIGASLSRLSLLIAMTREEADMGKPA